MQNTINKFVFEITCPDEDRAFHVRHSIESLIQDELFDRIDQVCDRVVGDSIPCRLNRIEIDLGEFSYASFERDFGKLAAEKFEQVLEENTSNHRLILSSISPETELTQLVIYFLETGMLPWWANNLETELYYKLEQLERKHYSILQSFLIANLTNEKIWRRMAYQLPPSAQAEILKMFPLLEGTHQLFINWIEILKAEPAFAQFMLRQPKPTDILAVAVNLFEGQNPISSFIEFISNQRSFRRAELDLIEQTMRLVTDAETIVYEMGNNVTEYCPPELNAPTIELEQIPNEVTEEGKQLVHHAGIVLLSPFFKTFFSSLNLLDDHGWIDKDCQCRAIHLLKYLSTGQEETPEYQLLLEKVLCGLPCEQPIPREIFLTPAEKMEAEKLLGAVIEHWNALKNSSINGLRETFLRRDGLLSKKDQNWLLQVERKTWDILLENLPWGYSFITLPWNNYVIETDW